MRLLKTALALLLLLCLCAGSVTVRADNELWSEEYYRAEDFSGGLSDAEREDLDGECLRFVETYHLDLVLTAVPSERLADTDPYAYAEHIYTGCNFGYGETRDGFLWLYVTDENRAEVFCFGAAKGRVPQDYIDMATGSAAEFAEEHGVYGALYIGARYLSTYLDEHPAGEGEASVPAERADGTPGMPDWYPDDPTNFAFFHDENAPRVVDDADIFTDAEEQRLETRIDELRSELQKDFVIYTDKTDYGLGKDICAADFYDFNGYGYGDEYEGVCLFIDMDPDDRGWWCACTGSETMGLYTEEIANLIDDELYEYMAGGAYADGVADWLENFRTLYRKGAPFAPEWYPAPGETLTPFHDPAAPRVVDDAGLLSDAEVTELTAQAARISQKYGADVAICTMPSPWGMDYGEVAHAYYTHMGYGLGEDYNGILLTVFKREGYYATSRITAFGAVNEKLSETNYDRLWDTFKGNATEDHYYRGASQWLKQVDHMLRTGRVARSEAYWVMICIFGALIGSIFGGIALGSAKKKMAPPREKSDADAYFDPGMSTIRDAGHQFLYTTTSRVYDPVEKEKSRSSSGGSSHHRSSYSSSYHGSSGRSHSGSGRSF